MTTQQLESQSQPLELRVQQLEARNQELEARNQQLESRLTALEEAFSTIKSPLSSESSLESSWAMQILGAFADCPEFDEAEKSGRAWRQSYKEDFDQPE
jgi:phage shock protein A